MFLTSAIPLTDELIEWEVIAPNITYIRNFIKRAQDAGYTIIRRNVVDPDDELALTPKQESVIRYATENGYYDVPKRITIEDLCSEFDCSKSTLSVIMRSAEKKIMSLYLEASSKAPRS